MSRTLRPEDLTGRTLVDDAGSKVGTIGSVYLADDTGNPEWATVKTGLFGHKESFVPLRGAELREDKLVAPVAKDTISGAPQMDADGHISQQESKELYRYYGLAVPGQATPGRGQGRQQSDAHAGRVREEEEAMTRSEERLRVGTEPVETGQVRLRKYVVTEQQQVNVPVRHEEARIEREPITDGTPGDHELTETEQEVTLHGEKPVVRTEAVPVEKVHLGKQTVTEEQTVTGEVRKEQIDADDTGKRRRR